MDFSLQETGWVHQPMDDSDGLSLKHLTKRRPAARKVHALHTSCMRAVCACILIVFLLNFSSQFPLNAG